MFSLASNGISKMIILIMVFNMHAYMLKKFVMQALSPVLLIWVMKIAQASAAGKMCYLEPSALWHNFTLY
jgi:hypothetical protein